MEEYKKAIELKDKQFSDIKKNLQRAKSYDVVIKENTELKQYIENIKQRYQQYQKQQQQEYFDRKKEYFRQKQPKTIKKLCTKKRVTVKRLRRDWVHTWRDRRNRGT